MIIRLSFIYRSFDHLFIISFIYCKSVTISSFILDPWSGRFHIPWGGKMDDDDYYHHENPLDIII